MGRKTFEVEKLKEQVNSFLRMSGSAEERKGMILVLEMILMQSDNYRGFQYLGKSEVAEGEKPGINWEAVGKDAPHYEKRFENTDPTRVKYF